MKSGSTTSLSLLRRVQAADDAAWHRLLELYGPLVFHWAQRMGLQEEDAADIVQEVFSAVSRAIGDFTTGDGNSSFRAWLFTITRNKVRDHFRRMQNSARAAGGTVANDRLAAIPDNLDASSEALTDPRQLSSLFHRALESVRCEFEDRTWQAFWRATVDEERTSEIAADMRITANAVRQAKSRVLRRLRQELGE